MTGSSSERRFQRLLRWYPRSWRDQNGAILVSTLREFAEQEGRTAPTAADVLSAALHGTAARLDRRFALVVALAGVACAAAAGILMAWTSAGDVVLALLSGAVPILAAAALTAVMRDRGALTDGRALATLGAAVIALSLNALTVASWSLGFDAADAGLPPNGLAAAWLPLLIAATLMGAIAIALPVESLLQRTGLPGAARVVLAAVIGFVAAPLVGLGLLSPLVAALITLGVAILALVPSRHAQPPRSTRQQMTRLASAALEGADPERSSRYRSTARVLAWVAVAGGAIGCLYAFSGSLWSAGAADDTIAMGQGITILLVASVPLFAAVGLTATAARPRAGAVRHWAPLTLVTAGFGSTAVGYLNAPSWAGMSPWFLACAVLVGGAISWWIIALIRLPRGAAVTTGLIAGILYAAFAGVMLAPMLAFAVPIGALILAFQRNRPKVADVRRHRQEEFAR
ncbi:UNVERIFIED_CONTAM: hypothetical protein OHV15_05405 [Microbacterium sp. SLM126]